MTASPVWFGPPARPLFGWFHIPPTGKARAGAVLCAPFSREYTQAHFALRLVAEQLAAQGVAALRFDYDGMGDSAGDNTDPDRVGAWLRSTAAACDFVRTAGIERLALVGMRIGATLAARAASDGEGVDQLVLWDPCISGLGFLREQQAVGALTLGITSKLADGSIDTPGLAYDPQVVRDLRALRLDGFAAPLARRLLVLTRPDRDTAHDVMATLAWESVEHGEALGQEALMDVGPPFQKLPHASIQRVVDWVAAGADTAALPVRPVPGASQATVGYDSEGRPIVERPFAVRPAGLFGMLTEVPDGPKGAPVAIFLSVANEHHIGPSRLWVDLSRRWAALGIRGLRVDLSGLGESPVRHDGQERFVARAPESFVDVEDAARAVGDGDPGRVLLVGLCSSAYQAIDSALGLRPAGIVAVNPVLSFVPAEVHRGLPVDRRRTVALPRKAAALAFRDTAPVSALRQRFPGLRRRLRLWAQPDRRSAAWVQAALGLSWRARLWARPSRRPAAWLPALVARGTDVLIVAGERDARPIRFGTTKRLLDKLTRTGHFRFEYIPDLEHALLIGAHRQMVCDLVTDHVVDRFAPSSLPADESSAAVTR